MGRSKNNTSMKDNSSQTELTDENTKLEEVILAEVMADHFINEMIKLKVSIETYKRRFQANSDNYQQLYFDKKELLILKYLSHLERSEKECFVSFLKNFNLYIL